jgi:hypothetical protein
MEKFRDYMRLKVVLRKDLPQLPEAHLDLQIPLVGIFDMELKISILYDKIYKFIQKKKLFEKFLQITLKQCRKISGQGNANQTFQTALFNTNFT